MVRLILARPCVHFVQAGVGQWFVIHDLAQQRQGMYQAQRVRAWAQAAVAVALAWGRGG